MDDAELGPGVRIEGAGSHVWLKRWLRLQEASGAQEGGGAGQWRQPSLLSAWPDAGTSWLAELVASPAVGIA